MLNFYDKNAQNYFLTTVSADFSQHYSKFIPLVESRGLILDVGCGSGRDSLYFKHNGFSVIPIDTSVELSNLAEDYIRQPVLNIDIKQIPFVNVFDGIWCCASLLHISEEGISTVINNLYRATRNNGVIYISLKEGNNEVIEEDGRTTILYNRDYIKSLVKEAGYTIVEEYNSKDSTGRDLKWFNLIAIKK